MKIAVIDTGSANTRSVETALRRATASAASLDKWTIYTAAPLASPMATARCVAATSAATGRLSA